MLLSAIFSALFEGMAQVPDRREGSSGRGKRPSGRGEYRAGRGRHPSGRGKHRAGRGKSIEPVEDDTRPVEDDTSTVEDDARPVPSTGPPRRPRLRQPRAPPRASSPPPARSPRRAEGKGYFAVESRHLGRSASGSEPADPVRSRGGEPLTRARPRSAASLAGPRGPSRRGPRRTRPTRPASSGPASHGGGARRDRRRR
jgi:hypothetical protein